MSDWSPNVAGRLEEIDRRLREIQAELVPGRVPRETQVPVTPPDPDPSSGSDAAPGEASERALEPGVSESASEPGASEPAPEPGATESASEPGASEPALEPGVTEPASEPGASEPAPEPGVTEPASESGVSEPAPEPELGEPAAEPEPASPGGNEEPADAPRGRSGPLAEALQHARSARMAGLSAPREPAGGEQSEAVEAPAADATPEDPQAPQQPLAKPSAQGPPPPQAQPGPPPPPPPPRLQQGPREAAGPDPRVDVLAELQSGLLTATRDLLDGYERASFTASERRVNRLTISAGPFTGTESLHAFEQELSRLPGVRDVGVRGYEGSDRAIIEVELGPEEG